MMAMWMNAEMTALTQPPFFLSRPADSIRTSSNIAGTSGFTETCGRIDAALTGSSTDRRQRRCIPEGVEPSVCDVCRDTRDRAVRWRRLRFALAMTQMTGVALSLALIIARGV